MSKGFILNIILGFFAFLFFSLYILKVLETPAPGKTVYT